jgi:hypothetical protein
MVDATKQIKAATTKFLRGFFLKIRTTAITKKAITPIADKRPSPKRTLSILFFSFFFLIYHISFFMSRKKVEQQWQPLLIPATIR